MPKSIVKHPAELISKEALQVILEASNVEEKAMWLISLNLAYYTADLVALPKDKVDLSTGVVIFRRTKNSHDRAGILWQETINSIIEYQKEMSHRGQYLFYSQDKAIFATSTIKKKRQRL